MVSPGPALCDRTLDTLKTDMSAPILEVSGLCKKFCRNPHRSLKYFLGDVGREILRHPPSSQLRTDEFWAVQDVNLDVGRGEVFGVVGRNGAGKSTLINLIAGIVRPTAGRVLLRTRRVALMDHGGGLNPALTGRENIRKMLALHGCPAAAIPDKEEAAVDFAEIGAFIDAAVGTYSLGMRQRLAFSIYSQLEPDLFIADEALNGGDLNFRRKFSNFLKDYIAKGGSILLCSHDLITIQTLCPRSLLLEHGRMVASGDTLDILNTYHQLQWEKTLAETQSKVMLCEDTKTESRPDEVSIVSVAAKAPEGGRIFPGGLLSFEIRCLTEKLKEKVCCVIEIGNEMHSALATLVFGYSSQNLNLFPGTTTLRCNLQSLPLAAGRYHARCYIAEKETCTVLAAFGMENRPLEFTVVKPSDAVVNIAIHRNNIVHMQASWTVEANQS